MSVCDDKKNNLFCHLTSTDRYRCSYLMWEEDWTEALDQIWSFTWNELQEIPAAVLPSATPTPCGTVNASLLFTVMLYFLGSHTRLQGKPFSERNANVERGTIEESPPTLSEQTGTKSGQWQDRVSETSGRGTPDLYFHLHFLPVPLLTSALRERFTLPMWRRWRWWRNSRDSDRYRKTAHVRNKEKPKSSQWRT